MKKFEAVKAQYLSQGVKEDNILYAVDAIKEGTPREHILENLTADYRGMDYIHATQMLEELYVANGGEFKKENRYGYLYGAFFLMMGGAAAFYIFYVFTYGGILYRPILVWAAAIIGILGGIGYIIKAMSGNFREADEPFKD